MTKQIHCSALILLAAVACGCAKSYVFRDDYRPAYNNTVTVDELVALQNQGAAVFDVRLTEDFVAEPRLIPDAMYRDPEAIEEWAAAMSPSDQPVIVYCVRGKWVSQKAANYLRDHGFDVYSLEGGIEAWRQTGMETTSTSAKPE